MALLLPAPATSKREQRSSPERSVLTENETCSSSSLCGSKTSIDHLHEHLFFSLHKLIGREKETRLLHNAYNGLLTLKKEVDTDPDTPSTTRSLALISGKSGSGKSALAMSLKQRCLDNHGFFVSGKFDLHQMEEPFAGIRAAMIELCHQIQGLPRDDSEGAAVSDPRRLPVLRQLLVEDLEPAELQALRKIIPGLVDIVNDPKATPGGSLKQSPLNSASSTANSSMPDGTTQQKSNPGFKEQSEGLKFALKRFIQIICNYCPLVLLVDDIQWADRASLDLIQSWVSNVQNPALMIIGCYRSDLFDNNRVLKETILSLEARKRERGIRIVNIKVEDLQLDHIVDFLREVLDDGADVTPSSSSAQEAQDNDQSTKMRSLAKLVLEKTGGNPFFIQQYLHSLIQHGLLFYEEDAIRWTWNIDDITSKSASAIDVIDLLKNKLAKVPAARKILPVAACLGATFSASILSRVIRSMLIHSSHKTFCKELFEVPSYLSENSIRDMLRICESEGLLEPRDQRKHSTDAPADESSRNETSTPRAKTSKRRSKRNNKNKTVKDYAFVHDKVQEASLALIPKDKLSELQFRVGEVLLSSLSADELDRKIFMVTSLINTRSDLLPAQDNSDRRMRIAMLNHQAGTKAVECSAFHPALDHFKKAIALLPQDHWQSNFQQTLKIYSCAAECAYAISDMDAMQVYCNYIIGSKECFLVHKFRAYHVLIEASTVASKDVKRVDAVEICFLLLDQLGCKFPKTKMGRDIKNLRGMVKMKMACQKWDAKTFSDLPVCTDSREAMITKTLGKLSFALYFSNPKLLPLVAIRTVKRTFAHGVTTYAPPAFAMLAMLMGSFMNEPAAGELIGKAALEMAHGMDSKESVSRTMMSTYITVMHNTALLEEVTNPFLKSYRIGMMTGDTESACWSAYCYVEARFAIGTPLAVFDADASTYSKIMGDLHKDTLRSFILMYWQATLNLRGASEHNIALIGDAFDERAPLQEQTNAENPVFLLVLSGNKLILASHFREYELGAGIIMDTYDELLQRFPGVSMLVVWLSLGGLCCYAASYGNSRTRSKHLKMAKRCRQQIKAWEKQGNPNCSHFCALLTAEKYAVRRQHSLAVANYKKAIDLAGQRGLLHYQAIASERFGDFLLRNKMGKEAISQYDESMRLYSEWGADKKVGLLQSRINILRHA